MKRTPLLLALCLGLLIALAAWSKLGISSPIIVGATPPATLVPAGREAALPTQTAADTPAGTPTPQPTNTSTATSTVLSTATPQPTPTATPPPSDTPTPTQEPVTATSTRAKPSATRTRVPPTRTKAPPTATVVPTSEPPAVEPTRDEPPTPASEPAGGAAKAKPVVVNGRTYDAYIPAATKKKQYYHYTCEFDASWVVFKTYGIDVTLDDQLAQIGLAEGTEPYFKETKDGVLIYGGDITNAYSGDYKENFLARSTGLAMSKVFRHYGLRVTPVHSREGIEAALLRGELVWVKVTADFKPGRPSTWIMPDGRTWQTVLGNDHAAVVMGFNKDAVVIRDVLGPTNTNYNRKYEYEVPWAKFLAIFASQSNDGLAVAPPGQ